MSDSENPDYRDPKGRFTSGNPGRPKGAKKKVTSELAELCKEQFDEHFKEVVLNVMSSNRVDMQVRLIEFLADRFAGKARQDVGIEVENAVTASDLFSDLMRKVVDDEPSDNDSK